MNAEVEINASQTDTLDIPAFLVRKSGELVQDAEVAGEAVPVV